jgi:putative ABC transport system ATP-binding protein
VINIEILDVEGLSKKYGNNENEFYAISNISFKVNKGEFIAIVGRSGSGKSTLLHLLGGLDTPDSGSVIINGQDIYNLSDKNLTIFRRKNMGIIYQFYNLLPFLNVQENIMLPALFDRRVISDKVLDNLLKTLGLNKKNNSLPNDLSGGQQQRVAIGRALINRPKILLADEPTGNLDSKNSLQIMKLLKFYNKKYKQTIIMVTHDLLLAKKASRIIEMADGHIIGDSNDKSIN